MINIRIETKNYFSKTRFISKQEKCIYPHSKNFLERLMLEVGGAHRSNIVNRTLESVQIDLKIML